LIRNKIHLNLFRAANRVKPAQTLASVLLIALVGWWLIAAKPDVSAARGLPPQARAAHPNVILITVDTLRADHLGVYGDKEIQTPFIDSLARAGARFVHAYTPVPITLPSHTALMTGCFPTATGMHDFSGNKLSANVPTLATILSKNGYQTAAFIGAAVLDSRFGLNQGFETYFGHFDFSRLDETNLDLSERRGDQVMNEALGWLKGRPAQAGKPFFLWVHLYDPHYPYTPPQPFAGRYRSHPYDGEIAFADSQVGRLMAYLKERRLDAGAVFVLAADHGEGLGEHGEKTHGFFVYNSTLHVPLLVKIPGAAPRVIENNVSLVDVMPTVLQALKISVPPDVQGRSVLDLIEGRAGKGSNDLPPLYAETYLPLLHFHWSQLRALQSGNMKYIEAPRPELYDTRADPHEQKNLYPAQQSSGKEMKDKLSAFLRQFTPMGGSAAAGKEPTDPALMQRLRSLGYVAISGGSIADASGKALPDPKDRIEVYELFSDAMADGQHGRYEESLRKLAEAEKSEPDSLPIHYLMALNHYRMKDYRGALEEFKTALQIDPKFALAMYYQGLTQLETGDMDSAGVSFERALALDPTNFSAAYNLGAVMLRKGHVEEALRRFQQAVEVNPDYAQAYEAMGEIQIYLKRNDEAIGALERAVAIAPDFRKAHYNLGRAYQAAGRTADAQREFARAQGK
jgi:arylsulfatase A-like enzyme/Tfp pilus assembly protein PilF